MLVHECRVELNGRRGAGEAVDRCPSGRRHGGSYGEAGAQSCSFGDGLRCLELGLIEPHALPSTGLCLLEIAKSLLYGLQDIQVYYESESEQSSIEQISIVNESN